jgi:hypothetical protein
MKPAPAANPDRPKSPIGKTKRRLWHAATPSKLTEEPVIDELVRCIMDNMPRKVQKAPVEIKFKTEK